MMDSLVTAPTSMHVGIFIGIAAFLLGFVNQALKFFDRFKETPPSHEKYATKADLAALKDEVDQLQEKIESNYRESIKAGESRATKIHERINVMSEKLAELVGEVRRISPK